MLLITSDFHIGNVIADVDVSKSELMSYNKHLINAVSDMVSKYKKENKRLSAFIIAGDLFHSNKPTYKDICVWSIIKDIILEVTDKIIVLLGNHDSNNLSDFNILYTLNVLNKDSRIEYIVKPKIVNIKDDVDLSIFFIPHLSHYYLKNKDFKISYEDRVSQEINSLFYKYKNQFNSIVGHAYYSKDVGGDESTFCIPGIKLPKIKDKMPVFLGHNHSPLIYENNIYSIGSVLSTTFGDNLNIGKRYLEYSIKDKSIKSIPINYKINMIKNEFSFDYKQDINDISISNLFKNVKKGDYYKLILNIDSTLVKSGVYQINSLNDYAKENSIGFKLIYNTIYKEDKDIDLSGNNVDIDNNYINKTIENFIKDKTDEKEFENVLSIHKQVLLDVKSNILEEV